MIKPSESSPNSLRLHGVASINTSSVSSVAPFLTIMRFTLPASSVRLKSVSSSLIETASVCVCVCVLHVAYHTPVVYNDS